MCSFDERPTPFWFVSFLKIIIIIIMIDYLFFWLIRFLLFRKYLGLYGSILNNKIVDTPVNQSPKILSENDELAVSSSFSLSLFFFFFSRSFFFPSFFLCLFFFPAFLIFKRHALSLIQQNIATQQQLKLLRQ